MRSLDAIRNFEEWRATVRPLLATGNSPLRMSRGVMRLLECIAHFRDPGRWELMYRLAWRAIHENSRLLEDHADPDVRRATLMERAVERACHKMHAFVRFREFEQAGETRYFAWFEPEHEILPRAAPFFCKRFPNMTWMIATPDGAAVWRNQMLEFVEMPDRAMMPREDTHEALWRTYYRSICNVSRVNPSAMQREMPRRYWHNLPEAREIPELVREGRAAFERNAHESDESSLASARAVTQALARLPNTSEGIAACRRCELWRQATQPVVGEGPENAAIMLIGEQPGDEEDLRGRPFIGPAGRVLDAALNAAGIARDTLFVTNAVKHFKWQPRGKRRLHKKPDAREVTACSSWLMQEIATVSPRILVALGATAVRAISGASLSIEQSRGQAMRHASGARIVCTYHPSAILRATGEQSETLRKFLVEDLRTAKRFCETDGVT